MTKKVAWATCSRCGGRLHPNSLSGICTVNPECRKANQKAKEQRLGERHLASSRAAAARWRASHPDQAKAASRRGNLIDHGPDAELVIAAMRAEQGGRCYLCGEPFPEDGRDRNGFVDHDHTCPHPRKGTKDGTRGSCAACRRGLSCHNCNVLIGLANDDPALLRRIAGNLERVLGPTRERIAARPLQLTLDPP